MKNFFKTAAFTAIAAIALNSASAQSSTFDPATGIGFAAKGDVQLALGLNNAQYQSTTFAFTYAAEVVTELTWECQNNVNQRIQERERTTTSSVSNVVAALARVKNQITGHNLTGFSSVSTSSVSDGPAVNTCQNNWTLVTEAGDPVEISRTGGLKVNGVDLPTL